MIRISWASTFALSALLLSLVLNVIALPVFPPPHCDEATYGSIAFEILRSGEYRSEMTGDLFGLDQYNSAVGRLWVLGMSLFIKLFGVQLLSARLYSLVGGIVGVWLTYMVGRELRDRWTGLVAAMLVAFSWKMFYAAHMARPEVWLVVSVLLALFWLIKRVKLMNQMREAVIGGLLCVLPLEFHALGVFFLVGFLVAYVYYSWSVAGSWRILTGVGTGVGCGLLIWFGVHFLPNPNLAWLQWTVGVSQMNLVASPSITVSLGDFGSWFFGQFIANNRFLGILETCVYVIGALHVLRRRSTQTSIIAIVAGSSLALFAVTNSQKSPQYAVVWVPLLSILSAHAFVALGTSLTVQARFLSRLAGVWHQVLVVLPVLCLFFVGNLWLTVRYPSSGFERTLTLMRQHIPTGVTVLGDPIWWWGFAQDRYYVGDWYLASKAHLGGTVFDIRAELISLGADYVILDDSIACTLSPSLLDQELHSLVSKECKLETVIEGAWHGYGSYESNFQFGQVSRIYACGGRL